MNLCYPVYPPILVQYCSTPHSMQCMKSEQLYTGIFSFTDTFCDKAKNLHNYVYKICVKKQQVIINVRNRLQVIQCFTCYVVRRPSNTSTTVAQYISIVTVLVGDLLTTMYMHVDRSWLHHFTERRILCSSFNIINYNKSCWNKIILKFSISSDR